MNAFWGLDFGEKLTIIGAVIFLFFAWRMSKPRGGGKGKKNSGGDTPS